MIRVQTPPPPPVLLRRGPKERLALRAAFDAEPGEYRKGRKRFEFKAMIYAAREVKEALRNSQHQKCAFCESTFTHTGFGDVEHFRPKGGYKQREADRLQRPGYYWLAYEWSNLFFSCQLCNQQFKKNLFPLKNPRKRARWHRHDLDKEEPLLIDPGRQDPRPFIRFHEHFVVAVRPEGETTIRVLGLDRLELVEARRKHLAHVKALHDLCEMLREKSVTDDSPALVERLRKHAAELDAMKQDESAYSAMVRDFLETNP